MACILLMLAAGRYLLLDTGAGLQERFHVFHSPGPGESRACSESRVPRSGGSGRLHDAVVSQRCHHAMCVTKMMMGRNMCNKDDDVDVVS